jgi:autotransporter-associated beta strand protein
MRHIIFVFFPLAACLFLIPTLNGQLVFDGVPVPADSGAQNGGGDWNTTSANWYDTTAGQNVVWTNGSDAAFGNSNSSSGGTINITEAIQVGDMRFNSLLSIPTLPSGIAHTFVSNNGLGSLTFADNATITAADLSSSGSGTVLFINFNLATTAHDLTIAREPTAVAAFQYLRFAADNTLTGELHLKSATDARGIFLLTAADNTLSGLDRVIVDAGSVLATTAPVSTGHTYTTDIHIAGNGVGNGAIRVDTQNITYTGEIVLTGDAGIMTNASGNNAIIKGGISETGAGFGFARFASAIDTVLTIASAGTYTGATTFGRSGSVAGGITVLDFSLDGAPEDDMLYNNVATAGGLNLIGGTYARAALTLKGGAADNSQRFGNLSVSGTRGTITMISGEGFSMDMSIGSVTRVLSTSTLALVTPESGSVATTQAAGLVGPWATISNSAGQGGWMQSSGGFLTTFTGTTEYTTGADLSTLGAGADAFISGNSYGSVVSSASSVINTLSMTDTISRRVVDVGAGRTLRLGQLSGIQITAGAKSVEIGRPGSAGSLTAGTASGAHLHLTNMSPGSTLTVHSQIVNNAGGAVNVYANGTGNVVLAGDNTYTGITQVSSGSLEIRHNSALGTTAGNTVVLAGGSLRISSNITTAENLTIAGPGETTEGALRNISGDNTLTGLTTVNGAGRINADAGSLTFLGASTTTNVISSAAIPVTFGGTGTIIIDGRLTATSSTITKDGTGMLVMKGDNNYAGTTSITNGTLRLMHNNGLGTTAGVTNISTTGALELYGSGLSLTETVNVASTGINNSGGLRNAGGDNTITSVVGINGTARIMAEAGTTFTFDAATGASAIIKDNSANNRLVTFGGAGNIVVEDGIGQGSGSGIFSIAKDGTGTLTVKNVSTYSGSTSISGGEMHLDFRGMTTPVNLLYNGATSPGALSLAGSTLRITGKSGATTSQHFGQLTIGLGQSRLIVDQNGATAVNLAFGNITRPNYGSVLEITPPTTGAITTSGGQDNQIIDHDKITSVTWGKNDWAATTAAVASRRTIVGLSSIDGGYTASTATSLAGNADVVLGAGVVALGTETEPVLGVDLTSLRFNAAQFNVIDLTAGVTLTTGGILVGEGVGANDTYIDGGFLRSASTATSFNSADLVIVQNNTLGDLVISSVISNNASPSSSTSLTKSGAGTLILENVTHTYNGTTKVTEGILHLRSGTINTAGQYTLGGGATSGKFKLGNNTTALLIFSDWLQIDGNGTENALVGGGTVLSTFLLDGANITSDFRKGFIGGSGQYENNISIRMAADNAPLQLGSNNTFAGKTTISFGIIEVEKLANLGQTSSLGRGDFSGLLLTGDSGIIDLSNRTTLTDGLNAISTLRYIGSTDSSTNRVVRISNTSLVEDITAVVGILENTGTGTVKFTSGFLAGGGNTTSRVLRLSGTNTGANEIVSFANTSATILSYVEKTGTGTWAITGDSAHSGGTQVLEGTLLAKNTTGSATGTGNVTVAAGATLGGTGRVAPAANNSVTVNGAISVGDSTLAIGEAASLEITTTGTGTLTFKSGSSLVLDIFQLSGAGDQSADTTAADLLVVNGTLVIEEGVRLQLVNVNDMIDWAANDRWTLFDWAGVTVRTGEFEVLDLPGLGGGLTWDTSQLYIDGTIAVAPIPEPARALLLVVGLGAALLRRRRTPARMSRGRRLGETVIP